MNNLITDKEIESVKTIYPNARVEVTEWNSTLIIPCNGFIVQFNRNRHSRPQRYGVYINFDTTMVDNDDVRRVNDHFPDKPNNIGFDKLTGSKARKWVAYYDNMWEQELLPLMVERENRIKKAKTTIPDDVLAELETKTTVYRKCDVLGLYYEVQKDRNGVYYEKVDLRGSDLAPIGCKNKYKFFREMEKFYQNYSD